MAVASPKVHSPDPAACAALEGIPHVKYTPRGPRPARAWLFEDATLEPSVVAPSQGSAVKSGTLVPSVSDYRFNGNVRVPERHTNGHLP